MMFSATEAGECVILEGNPCGEAQGVHVYMDVLQQLASWWLRVG